MDVLIDATRDADKARSRRVPVYGNYVLSYSYYCARWGLIQRCRSHGSQGKAHAVQLVIQQCLHAL